MKREITEAVTFTKTLYSCDLCEKQLLAGARLHLCWVCDRECCSGCVKLIDKYSGERRCFPCCALDHFLVPINEEETRHNVQKSTLYAQWKAASLKSRSMGNSHE